MNMNSRSKRSAPIGVFDSGLGGLTVVREFFRQMPFEKIIYLGDTAHLPYGSKSARIVAELAYQNVEFLVRRGVKIVVVACNTASAMSLDMLKRGFSVPIEGVIEPGAQAALEASREKRIGVIGTHATVSSMAYPEAIRKICPETRVFQKACPLFVPIVEEGWANTRVAKLTAKIYLSDFRRKGIDVLVLGCTHYPLLKKTIAKVAGRQVKLIDSAEAVVRQVKDRLSEKFLENNCRKKPDHRFFVTDFPQKFSNHAGIFLGQKIEKVTLVKS